MLSKAVQRFLILWGIGALAIVGGLALLTGLMLKEHGWWGYLSLVNAGAVTRAEVVRVDRADHCVAEYAFVVESHSYSGRGSDCNAQVGDPVFITFLKSDPSHSCLGFANDALRNELRTFVLGGVIFPPFLLLLLRLRRRNA